MTGLQKLCDLGATLGRGEEPTAQQTAEALWDLYEHLLVLVSGVGQMCGAIAQGVQEGLAGTAGPAKS